jgi:predicted Rossmann fold flavoprotein
VTERVDIAIVGAGAAGLMAAIFAGRTARESSPRVLRILALDGAKKIGAKILVAGGGRCNVTHHAVDETAYAGGPGSTRPAIRNVLRRFDVPETIAFFRELGVELKREETGKLFPTTDDAHTVLNAMLGEIRSLGVELRHPWRVNSVTRIDNATHPFRLEPSIDEPRDESREHRPAWILASRVILATGGMALPKSGSDGHGYSIARELGHSTTGRIFPALVPLLLAKDQGQPHWLTQLSGITLPAALEVKTAEGKILTRFENSTLLTHFGLSGPAVLDISRYYLDALAQARADRTPYPVLTLNTLPMHTQDSLDTHIISKTRVHGHISLTRLLTDLLLPDRLARALAQASGLDAATPLHAITREQRQRLIITCCELPLPIAGDRGFTFAEVTAGGVPLRELDLKTMHSRLCSGLHLCGEILDVDGRIGGFNFQWAWASSYVAGTSAAAALAPAT